MGSFGHSSNIPSDFEFKNIPKVEFQKVIKQVESDMKRKKSIVTSGRRQIGMWGNFCTVSHMDESENEENGNFSSRSTTANSDVHTVYITPKPPNSPPFAAPLFGPPQRLNIEELKSSRVLPSIHSKNSKKTAKSSHNSGVRIKQKANVADVQKKKLVAAKNQVPQKITAANDADDVGWFSSDNDETLHSEMLELCNQIENVNGSNSSSFMPSSSSSPTSSPNRNSNQRAMQLVKNIMNKTENESLSEEKHSNYVDKKFDFRHQNEDESVVDQIVEPHCTVMSKMEKKMKNRNSGDDSTNDNNVYIPKMPNQMSKNEQQQQRQRHCEESLSVKAMTKRTVASPSESHKAQSVVSDVFGNEKSQEAESAVMVSKALGYMEKICEYLDRLQVIISEPPQLEDLNDLKKRQQRAIEFTNRFARNHLYQIGRMAEELHLMPDNPMDVATKVNLLFHAVMQAVQTYLKNVEMFIYNSYPDKLFVLVDLIINASKICFDRKVYDKKDAVIVKMLRKSVEMKRFLEMNKRSVAKFESTSKPQPRLQSRNSYAYGNVETNEKYAIYGNTAMKEMNPKRSVVKSGNNPFDRATKSPYNIPQMPEKNTKQNLYNTRQKGVPPSTRNTPATKALSLGVRKSISNVTTMVHREKQQPPACVEEIEEKSSENGKTEKPLEGSKVVVGMEKTDVSEIMAMLRNIAKDKIQEIIAPFMAEFMPNSSEKLATQPPPTRVTAEVKPKKPDSSDPSKSADSNATVQSVAQYTLEKSKNESEETLKALPSEEKTSLFELTAEEEPSSEMPEVPKTKIVTSTLKPPSLKSDDIAKALEVDDSDDDCDVLDIEAMKNFKEIVLKERKAYQEKMSENPMYLNDEFGEPWNKFGSISEHLIDEMLMSIVADFDLGERSMVEEFFQKELAC